MNAKVKQWVIVVSYCALMVLLIINFGALLGGVNSFFSILTPFIMGYVIAFVLNRPFMYIEKGIINPIFNALRIKKPGIKKAATIITVYVLLFTFISMLISFVLPALVSSVMDFANSLPTQLEQVAKRVNELIVQFNIQSEIVDIFGKYWAQMLTTLSDILMSTVPAIADTAMKITAGVSNMFVGIVVSVYLLMSKDKMINQAKKILYAFVPSRRADYVMHVGRVTNRTFGGFLTGQLIVSLIVGLLCFAGMTVFKMPYAMLASVVVGVTNVIPYFGPIIGAVPGTLIILLTDPVKALGFVIMIMVIQQFDGNFMSPKIVGGSIGLSGVWVLFSILVGGGLFGIKGMVIGLPAFAVIYTLLRESTHSRLAKKGRSLQNPEETFEPVQPPQEILGDELGESL